MSKLIQNPNISEVAKLANVSVKTISRVVNKEPNVRQTTIDKVELAIKKLNYKPNVFARALRTKRSYNIGLIYSNPSPYYITEIQNGVTFQCNENLYDALIHPCQHNHPNIIAEISELFTNGKVDGLILTPPLSDHILLLEHLNAIKAPFVCVSSGHQTPNIDCVYSNEKTGAKQITEYLIELGHTHIGFIIGNPEHGGSYERLEGFKQALAERKINFDASLVKQGYFSVESGRKCATELLQLDNRPTAIFASNDDMAVGAIISAQKMGIKVPDDVSIAGFDDSPIAEHIWPRLTTMKQPIEQLAQTATMSLLAKLSNNGKDNQPIEKQLNCTLVIRESIKINHPMDSI